MIPPINPSKVAKLKASHPLGETACELMGKEDHEDQDGWFYNMRILEGRGAAYPAGTVVMAEPYEVELRRNP